MKIIILFLKPKSKKKKMMMMKKITDLLHLAYSIRGSFVAAIPFEPCSSDNIFSNAKRSWKGEKTPKCVGLVVRLCSLG